MDVNESHIAYGTPIKLDKTTEFRSINWLLTVTTDRSFTTDRSYVYIQKTHQWTFWILTKTCPNVFGNINFEKVSMKAVKLGVGVDPGRVRVVGRPSGEVIIPAAAAAPAAAMQQVQQAAACAVSTHRTISGNV